MVSCLDVAKAIPIASNTALRALCFDLSLPTARHATHGAAWVLVTLSQVTSRALEGVTFRLGEYYAAGGFPELFPWDGIDELLSTQDVFGNLRTVQFVLCSDGGSSKSDGKDRERERQWIRVRMERLNERGVLIFG